MRLPAIVLRAALLALAWVHTFPARRHLGQLASEPSWGEAWKAIGALLAVGLYLLPVRIHARALTAAWARRRALLAAAGWALALAHLVPALDHLPRFAASSSWSDAWRGFGAAAACAWFVLPLATQARVLGWLRRAANVGSAGWAHERWKLAGVVALGLVLGAATGVRVVLGSHTPRAAMAGPVLRVPHAAQSVVVDGELDDAIWAGPTARTGGFTAAGAVARPYSDVRLAWRDDALVLALYAADEDIRATGARHDDPLWIADAFQLVFRAGDRERTIDVSPNGVVTDGERRAGGAPDVRWESRARVAVEHDGTPNDPTDDDEEWVVEIAIPLEALGVTGRSGERIGFEARRCDAPKGGARTCAGWGEGASGEGRGEIVFE